MCQSFKGQQKETAMPIKLIKWHAASVATLLALIGMMLLFFSCYGYSPFLRQPDPLIGLNNRIILFLVGTFHMAVSGWLLQITQTGIRALVPLWVGSNYAFYLAGMSWAMKIDFPLPVTRFIGGRIGVDPAILQIGWMSLIFYFSLGSLVLLAYKFLHARQLRNNKWSQKWLEHRRLKTDAYPKMFCPYCGVHIRFDLRNLGRQIPCPHCQKEITLQKPDETLKMSCFFCKEHIEFPAHAVGRKLKCPHCYMDITLKVPANV